MVFKSILDQDIWLLFLPTRTPWQLLIIELQKNSAWSPIEIFKDMLKVLFSWTKTILNQKLNFKIMNITNLSYLPTQLRKSIWTRLMAVQKVKVFKVSSFQMLLILMRPILHVGLLIQAMNPHIWKQLIMLLLKIWWSRIQMVHLYNSIMSRTSTTVTPRKILIFVEILL